jgi:hypothetical protein
MKINSIEDWLLDPRAEKYFGGSFRLKLEVLACAIDGGNVSAVARERGVTRQAASKHARKAWEVFGFLSGILSAHDESQGQHLYRIAEKHPGYIWADHFVIEITKWLAARELQFAELVAQIKSCLDDGRFHLAHLLPEDLKHLATAQ